MTLDIEKIKSAALEALDNLDDYARMECGIEPIGAVNHLTNFITTVCARLEAAEKDAARYLYICEIDHKDRNWIDSFDDYKKRRDSRIDEAMKESA